MDSLLEALSAISVRLSETDPVAGERVNEVLETLTRLDSQLGQALRLVA